MKIKQKKYILTIIGILFITITIFHQHIKETKDIKYSKEAVTLMKEKKIYNFLKQKEYNKTIETMLMASEFNEKYVNDYAEINYTPKVEFPTLVNTFLQKNYSPLEINNILEYLSDKNINKLKNLDYIDLGDFVKVSNIEIENIERYKNYQNTNQTNLEDTVTKVNIGLDHEFYSEIKQIDNPNSITVLVNKYRALPDDYIPNDLTSLSINPNMKLRSIAAIAYENLQSAAILDNIKIIPFSTYRTKDYQNKLYTKYSESEGSTLADTYSARPRHSEHETGLAVDVRSESLLDNLTENDYRWMLNNSYKYGFIVRYAYATSAITGYIEEPWHLRYVGIKVATDIHDKNITFDEYYDLYLKDQEELQKN